MKQMYYFGVFGQVNMLKIMFKMFYLLPDWKHSQSIEVDRVSFCIHTHSQGYNKLRVVWLQETDKILRH